MDVVLVVVDDVELVVGGSVVDGASVELVEVVLGVVVLTTVEVVVTIAWHVQIGEHS